MCARKNKKSLRKIEAQKKKEVKKIEKALVVAAKPVEERTKKCKNTQLSRKTSRTNAADKAKDSKGVVEEKKEIQSMCSTKKSMKQQSSKKQQQSAAPVKNLKSVKEEAAILPVEKTQDVSQPMSDINSMRDPTKDDTASFILDENEPSSTSLP